MTDWAAPRACRFRSDAEPGSAAYSALPDDGMCLSVYVVLRSSETGSGVVAGRLDPDADWPTIGAIPRDRLVRISQGWMLPSRHLRLFEDPGDAAKSILADQLGVLGVPLRGPRVFSETYRREGPAVDPHWDLQFVYEGAWPVGRDLVAAPWRELRLLDLGRTAPGEFVRAHGDILELLGTPASGH